MAQEESQAVNSAVQDTAVTDSAPVEETSLEVVSEGPALDARDFQQTETESESEDVADDTAESEPAAETETTEESDKPLAPKSENRFQKLANENRELREALAATNARKAQVAVEQELLNEVNPETGEYYTPGEAERIARMYSLQQAQQRAEQEAQSLQQQQHLYTIGTEAQQVVNDFPIFNPESPDYNAEVAKNADDLLQANLVFDQQGNIIGSNVSPYQLYQTVANAYNASAVANQIKGQKAAEKMLSQADNPSSAKPAKSSAKDDKELSPTEYAKQHNLKTVW